MRLIGAMIVGGCLLALGACSTPTPPAAGVVILQQPAEQADAIFIEGAMAFVEVRAADGVVVYGTGTAQYLESIELGRAELPPGDYVVHSYVRPCSGTCGHLDPPTDRCAIALTIQAGRTYEVLIERGVGRPCRASLVP